MHRFFSIARLLAVCVVTIVTAAHSAHAQDWSAFRGPDGLGKADAQNLPTHWDAKTNIVWKRELPGPGGSSPITRGSQVFITCYSGYAESIEKPGDMKNLMRHVLCLDVANGKITWQKSFKPKLPESEYKPGNDSRHGYASSTPATDGKRLYVFFGASGLYCLDLDGNILWHKSAGEQTHHWGSGTSPRLYKDLVIVNASIESESLIAFDKRTGEEKWRQEGIAKCWSSPMLVDVGRKQELVLNAPRVLMGFDPDTGEKLWYCDGLPDGYICPSNVSHDGIVYAIGARKNTAMAVRAGGRGDVTDSHVLWKTKYGSNVSSPVYVDGYLYWYHESRGMAYCLNAKTGEVAYQERLSPRPGLIYSSVTFADGKLYAISQENGTYVLAAKPEFELLAVNTFADDSSRANGSIAVANNRLILRTDQAIYCIGK